MQITPCMVTLVMSAAFALPTSAAAQSRAPVPAPVTFAPVAVVPPPQTVIEDPGAPFRTAIGFEALLSTTGGFNTAGGYQALKNNTTGQGNTAIGYQALFSNTTPLGNTAIGNSALLANTTGGGNTSTGSLSLMTNTTSGGNTANGYRALRANTGDSNTAVGFLALDANTTGGLNTATGYQALQFNTIGLQNVAMGANALRNTTGGSNTAIGNSAGSNATTGFYNIFVGAGVFGTATDTNTIRIGFPFSGGSGQNQTFIAGIYGTELTGIAHVVFIDANGQLGTVTPGVLSGTGTVPSAQLQQQLDSQRTQLRDQQDLVVRLQRQVQDQQTANAELRARLARVEALLRSVSGRK